MLNNESQAASSVILLNPVSAANTAAATSAWIAVPKGEGDVVFVAHVGAMTGSITWALETADDDSGTGAAAVTPTEGAFSAGAATQLQIRHVRRTALKAYARIIGTIVTGPSVVAAHLRVRAKIV